jgi:hypothetical protein
MRTILVIKTEIYVPLHLQKKLIKNRQQDYDFAQPTGMTYTQLLMSVDLDTNQEYYRNMLDAPIVSEVSFSMSYLCYCTHKVFKF